MPAADPFASWAWRHGHRLGPRGADVLLRVAPGRAFAVVSRRLATMGIDEAVAGDVLGRTRRIADWPDAWMVAAQRALGNARIAAKGGNADIAAHEKKQAALAFHAASWPPPDERTLRTLRSSAATLFAEAMSVLDPGIRPLEIPWRATRLPALLAHPPDGARAAPVVVLLNGATTSKEETIAWAGPFLRHGFAVLALDWPGTGIAAAATGPPFDCDDLLDGVLDVLAGEHGLDSRAVACVGASLGGALAIRLGQAERNVRAVVAITPPYDARAWLPRASPLIRDHLTAHAGGADRLDDYAAAFTLSSPAGNHRPPLLVFGAGRDVVVPPAEAVRAAAAFGDDATLLWSPRGAHALFDAIPTWTADAAAWLEVILAPASTRVDSESTPFADMVSPPPFPNRSPGPGSGQ